jgi:hypothetical protein
MTRSRRSIVLQFRPDVDDTDEAEDVLRGQLSAAVYTGGHLWLASDESNSVERLTETRKGEFGEHRMFCLTDFLELPGGPKEEIDIEGMSYDDDYLWLVGSHSLKRRKPKADMDAAEGIARLAELRSDGNRYLLARVPLAEDEDGDCVLHERLAKKRPRTAARLMGGDRGNLLMDALRLDAHLAPFLGIPGKDNGLDIEGLAVRGARAFLGLRGPVLRGWSVVLELRLEEAAPGLLQLAALDDDGGLYRKHFLDLRGLGVRDLCLHGDDLLVLAGPTMDLDGPAAVYRWRDALAAEESVLLGKDELDEVVDVPYGTGEHDARDHPEGITLFDDGDGESEALLVVYDSPDTRREEGESGVRADVFALD